MMFIHIHEKLVISIIFIKKLNLLILKKHYLPIILKHT